jgi:hypothetical protein
MADPLKLLLANARLSNSWEEFQANCSKLENQLGYTKFVVSREDKSQERENRIHDLHKVALDHSQDMMAMNILLRALIASSHDRKALRLSLQVLSEAFFDQSREHGFTTGAKPEAAKGVETGVRKQIDRWLAMLESK